ncbi:MAG: M23 family metallopeptidase [Ignavibacteria bacterium]|nr:M23 family metallopeptidase [Ignavibacteria bacterium]
MGKFYYFSKDRLRFVEARWAKTRMIVVVAAATLVTLFAGFEVNHYLDDTLGLGLGRAKVLAEENSALKDQLRRITSRIGTLEQRLAKLGESGNELRLLVDLPKIDDDVRKVGVGGAIDRAGLGFSPDAGKMMSEIHGMLDRTERELQLQTKSYNEVLSNYELNKVKFSHIPAIKPMEGYYIPYGFGMRLHPVLGIMKHHPGLDIANDVDTPVYASGNGIVRYAGRTGGGYGIMVEVDHGFGYTSAYAHLSKALVREGQQVKRGQLIARSGRTGLVSGPHLHYEVRLNGIRQNPLDFFFDDVSILEYRGQVGSAN